MFTPGTPVSDFLRWYIVYHEEAHHVSDRSYPAMVTAAHPFCREANNIFYADALVYLRFHNMRHGTDPFATYVVYTTVSTFLGIDESYLFCVENSDLNYYL